MMLLAFRAWLSCRWPVLRLVRYSAEGPGLAAWVAVRVR
jgi:hypothetical protein